MMLHKARRRRSRIPATTMQCSPFWFSQMGAHMLERDWARANVRALEVWVWALGVGRGVGRGRGEFGCGRGEFGRWRGEFGRWRGEFGRWRGRGRWAWALGVGAGVESLGVGVGRGRGRWAWALGVGVESLGVGVGRGRGRGEFGRGQCLLGGGRGCGSSSVQKPKTYTWTDISSKWVMLSKRWFRSVHMSLEARIPCSRTHITQERQSL